MFENIERVVQNFRSS